MSALVKNSDFAYVHTLTISYVWFSVVLGWEGGSSEWRARGLSWLLGFVDSDGVLPCVSETSCSMSCTEVTEGRRLVLWMVLLAATKKARIFESGENMELPSDKFVRMWHISLHLSRVSCEFCFRFVVHHHDRNSHGYLPGTNVPGYHHDHRSGPILLY